MAVAVPTRRSSVIFFSRHTHALVLKNRKPNRKLSEWVKKHREHIEAAAIRKAASYELLAKTGSAQTRNLHARKFDYCRNWGDSGGTLPVYARLPRAQ